MLMGGLPLFCLCFVMIFKLDSFTLLVEIFDRFLAVVPIINPILAIYVVKHYRDAVFNLIFGCFKKPCMASQIAITPISNINPNRE
jgi:hypothetical protein